MEPLIELHEFAKTKYEMGNANLLDVYHQRLRDAPRSEMSIPFTEEHRSTDEITNEVIQCVSCVHNLFPDLVSHRRPRNEKEISHGRAS